MLMTGQCCICIGIDFYLCATFCCHAVCISNTAVSLMWHIILRKIWYVPFVLCKRHVIYELSVLIVPFHSGKTDKKWWRRNEMICEDYG